jgi:hypothetical protein
MIPRVVQFAGLSSAAAAGMDLIVKGAGSGIVNGIYVAKAPTQIPVGFSRLDYTFTGSHEISLTHTRSNW